MARHKLTPAQVAAVKPDPTKTVTLSDGDGLNLIVKPDGAKNWKFRYSFAGKARWKGLGLYPTVTLAAARDAAETCRVQLSQGIDPIDSAREAKQAKKVAALVRAISATPETVAELFARWDTNHLTLNHSDGGNLIRGVFQRHVLPTLGEVPLNLLRPVLIRATLDKAYATGLTRTCGQMLDGIRQMCGYAIENEWLNGDPTALLKSSTWKGKGQKRDRTLSITEIYELKQRLAKSDLSERYQAAIWLLLATGCRVGETLLAEVGHVDLRKSRWLIPRENQKKVNGEPPPRHFIIKLSTFAQTQIEILTRLAAAEKVEAKRKWLFPAARGCNGAVEEKALAHQLRDRQRGTQLKGRTPQTSALLLQGGPWTAHDLRRTMATRMGELGVAPDVIDRCQNHRVVGDNKVREHYQRQEMRAQMREAWVKLGDNIEHILSLNAPPELDDDE